MSSTAQTKLVEFLEKRAFDPVMKAKPDRYEERDRKKLEDMQRRTKTEIERYRHYGSAEEVVTNFHRDLTSAPAKKVHAELKQLDLPTLDEVRDEFDKLAEELGLRHSG